MKRVIALLAALAMILAACGGGGSRYGGSDDGGPATTAGEDTTPATGAGDDKAEAPGDHRHRQHLALTGPLAPNAAIHKVAGDLFVERLNASGGLLGRPVEWRVLDDESVADQAAALYERLITEDGVDLIMGPYGTGAIAAAIQVAERYGYV